MPTNTCTYYGNILYNVIGIVFLLSLTSSLIHGFYLHYMEIKYWSGNYFLFNESLSYISRQDYEISTLSLIGFAFLMVVGIGTILTISMVAIVVFVLDTLDTIIEPLNSFVAKFCKPINYKE